MDKPPDFSTNNPKYSKCGVCGTESICGCTLQPNDTISPVGGEKLTSEQAAVALREAMQIIESVGTTGIYGKEKRARDWMRKYFPVYADEGDW